MTRREFLKLMDEIKEKFTEGEDFTCHAIELAQDNPLRNKSNIRLFYESVFDISTNPFDDINTRIVALELLEIISLEEKQYLNY